MELSLTEDQELFRATSRGFLEKECPLSRVRELADDPDGFDRAWWGRAAGLGWTSLLVSEEHGGGSLSGYGLRDLAVLAEECGRLVAPGPLLPVNVVASALSSCGTAAQRNRWLDGLLGGGAVATWAQPRPGLAAGASTHGWTLDGTVRAVEAAGQSDVFLLTAATGDGPTQFLVPADAPGLTVRAVGGLDTVRRFGTLHLDGVAVGSDDVLGRPGEGGAQVREQWRTAVALQCAETAGAIDRVLEFTLAWAFDRYSFGRPLASYQALKHRYATMEMWLEASHAITGAAVRSVAAGEACADDLLRAAAWYLGEHAPELVQDCVQMHGGLGVTWEHDIHLYLRRVTVNRALYGTPEEHAVALAGQAEVRA